MSFSVLSLFILQGYSRWSLHFVLFRLSVLSYQVTKFWILSPLSEAHSGVNPNYELFIWADAAISPFMCVQAVTCKHTGAQAALGTGSSSTSVVTCRQMAEPLLQDVPFLLPALGCASCSVSHSTRSHLLKAQSQSKFQKDPKFCFAEGDCFSGN